MKYLLFPFAVLYDLVTSIRNRLYDLGYKPSASFEVPLIIVGNLTVGGTGKTPMVEYLIRLLHPTFKIATLSRGYKRKTKGFRLLSPADNATTAGDEPYQLYKKFDGAFPVAVGEERALAISLMIDQYPELEAIIMDDAFQHRKVKGTFSILLSDYNKPFYNDFLLPSGRLRESRNGASRADVIIVTKSPEGISDEEQMAIENEIRRYADKPVFFSCIRYGSPLPLNHSEAFAEKVVLLSGIANPKGFDEYVRKHFKVVNSFEFPDHHQFSEREINQVTEIARQQNAMILTTEKDASRLLSEIYQAALSSAPFFYLPIEAEFLKNGQDFDEMVLNAVQGHHEP
jgi:tetraacyldisaccharide 4'-kinase